ncbi:MAG: ABC transporter ATP-binding protein, partial [Rhizobiales bacterium]|nr:ABC transporter ATP-binding protein [Hyphomicrobiales bacterium]
MTKAAKRRKHPPAAPGEIVAVIRRILAENGRDYVGTYAVTIACLLAVAGSTAFSAWIMRDVIDKVFYKQRYDLLVLICGSIVLAFAIRGIASYLQAVLLAKIGNNLVARYQQRMFDHLMRLGVSYFTATRSGQLAARINQNVAGVRDLLSL